MAPSIRTAVARPTPISFISRATPAEIYGTGACAEDAQASCFDLNRWISASAITVPPFPFENRPTFQQVVELTKTLPR